MGWKTIVYGSLMFLYFFVLPVLVMNNFFKDVYIVNYLGNRGSVSLQSKGLVCLLAIMKESGS